MIRGKNDLLDAAYHGERGAVDMRVEAYRNEQRGRLKALACVGLGLLLVLMFTVGYMIK